MSPIANTVAYISIKLYFYKTIFLYFSIFLYFYIFELEEYFLWRNISKKFHGIFLSHWLQLILTHFQVCLKNIMTFFDQMARILLFGEKYLNSLAANCVMFKSRILWHENIPQNLKFNPHTKIKIFLQKYRNIEI